MIANFRIKLSWKNNQIEKIIVTHFKDLKPFFNASEKIVIIDLENHE